MITLSLDIPRFSLAAGWENISHSDQLLLIMLIRERNRHPRAMERPSPLRNLPPVRVPIDSSTCSLRSRFIPK